MEPELITYQKFNDIALANNLADILQRHNIPYVIEEDSLSFNPTFVLNDELSKEYAVKINSDNFEIVNQLLVEEESANVDAVETDYYLFDFSDAELMEVITKADEWSAFDHQLALKIMTERGKPISDKEIEQINKKRLDELKVPDAPQTIWIAIGYITAILGGILGLFIGWYLTSYKKTLPNGEKVYGYTDNDRKQGKRILYINFYAHSMCNFQGTGCLL